MPRLIAIDLGAHSVKATVLNGSGRRYTLEGRHAEPVPQHGESRPGLEPRMAALATLLQRNPAWLKGNATFAVTWPGEQATLHRLRLPFTNRAQIEKTLPFAVEAEVPFELDDMVLGWRILSVTTDTEVLTCLVKRDALRRLLEGLANQKIDPRFVFVDVDVLGSWAPKGVSAIIDVGHNHTLVAVAKDGVVQYSRAVNVAGRDYIRAVQQALGVDWAQAEERLVGVGVATSGYDTLPEAARRALDAPIGLLLAEVRSTLILAEETLGIEIDTVHLCGGGSKLPPLAGFLAEDLGVVVETVVDASGGKVPPPFAEADALAARLAGQTKGHEIDLRLGEFAWRGGADLRAFLAIGAAAVAFFMLATIGMFAWNYRTLMVAESAATTRMQEVVAASLPEVDPTLTTDSSFAVEALRQKLDEARSRAEAFDRTGQAPPTLEKLKRLTEAFPPPAEVTVDVSELTLTPETVSFNALADGYTGSAAVEEALKASDMFKAAQKSNEKKTGDKVTFTITIPLATETATAEQEG